uniref:Uncharacterized protein n=1 Tax=Avena sativa TaxID=4498 RepID=A0ACD5Z1B4_AVESA
MGKAVKTSGVRRTFSNAVLAVVAGLLMLGLGAVAVAPAVAGIGNNCTTSCGNISIPYPFGVEPGCYLNGFNLTCRNAARRPKLFLGDGTVRVLNISLRDGTVRIRSSLVYLPQGAAAGTRAYQAVVANSTWGGALGASGPYFLSEGGRNKLSAGGCDVQAALLGEDNETVSTCAAFCPDGDDDAPPNTTTGSGSCSGMGCCQANIIFGRSSYRFQVRWLNGSTAGAAAAVFLGIVESTVAFDPLRDSFARALPAVLDWSINHTTCVNASSSACRSNNSFCQDTDAYGHHGGHLCHCSYGYDGNPYIPDGCQDFDECLFPSIYPCRGVCINTVGGYMCRCPTGYQGNPTNPGGCKDIDECVNPEAHSCYGICINMPGTHHCRCRHGTQGDPSIKGGCIMVKNSFSGLNVGLLVSGGSILLLMALSAPFLTRNIKKRRVKRRKHVFFKQNHGLLLQQLISQNTDFGERMIITLGELEKATNNFDKAREVGKGGHGVVYKGILNLHVVAIKKSKIAVQREIDEFINEVAILSQVNHRNVVKLLGCCLEAEVPLLVYEFISNGTLYNHLHSEGPISLSWTDRLRILLEVARALSYLHSATLMPIYHRDIKSSNILLDGHLVAKVSDFGASRYIPIDQTGVTTAVQGTIGYLDPEYYYTGRLTDKSDVFSFGVLIIELLTRKKPFVYRSNCGAGLISHFDSLLSEGNLTEIVDPQVMDGESGEVQEIAVLAVMCTKLKGEERPTMREVEMALENLRDTHRGSAPRRCNGDYTTAHYMSVQGVIKEASRQYTMEEEILLSARYPR